MRRHTARPWIITLSVLLALASLLPTLRTPQAAAQTACEFTAQGDNVPLYAAPLADPAQETGVLPAGISVLATKRSGLAYDALIYVVLSRSDGAWVDQRTGTLTGDCDDLPLDDMPLADYPSICSITSDQRLAFYDDVTLSTPKPFDLQPGRYVITREAARAWFVRLDHAMGGWIAKGDGALSPACAAVTEEQARTALTHANARVWTAPSVRTGELLYTLPENVTVTVVAGPVPGDIRYNSDAQGEWYQIAQFGAVAGWVWGGRLTLHDVTTPPTTPNPTATASDNARLWSLPDVRDGTWFTTLDPGTALIVLDGPVSGPIRRDTADVGDWYRVRVADSALTGWLWAGRLTLE